MIKKKNRTKRLKKVFAVALAACFLTGGVCGLSTSDVGIVTTEAATLAAPSTTSISNSGTNVTISWSKVSGASGYKVYRTTSAANAEKRIGTQVYATTGTSYTDKTSKTTGTTYFYFVKAYKGSTLGSSSCVRSYVKLATPTISSVSKSGTGKNIQTKWGTVKGAMGYEIMYSTNKNFYCDDTTKKTTSTSITISSSKNTTYYIKVRAYRVTYGKTYYSSWSSVKTVK